jgi:hypothetical protein
MVHLKPFWIPFMKLFRLWTGHWISRLNIFAKELIVRGSLLQKWTITNTHVDTNNLSSSPLVSSPTIVRCMRVLVLLAKLFITSIKVGPSNLRRLTAIHQFINSSIHQSGTIRRKTHASMSTSTPSKTSAFFAFS